MIFNNDTKENKLSFFTRAEAEGAARGIENRYPQQNSVGVQSLSVSCWGCSISQNLLPQRAQKISQGSQRFDLRYFIFVPFVHSLCPLWLKRVSEQLQSLYVASSNPALRTGLSIFHAYGVMPSFRRNNLKQ